MDEKLAENVEGPMTDPPPKDMPDLKLIMSLIPQSWASDLPPSVF